MRKGQTLPPKQRIRVELDLPKGFLNQFNPLPTSRVAGAAITAAGVYTMVRLVDQFGRGIIEGVKNIAKDIFVTTSVPVINFFTSIFGVQVQARQEDKRVPAPDVPGKIDWAGPLPPTDAQKESINILDQLGILDPFALGAALTAGGMVLAGQNPGEILKGIGSIIDALIPL